MEEENKRKIIEIYVTSKDDEHTFEIEKVEDSKAANAIMKMLLCNFSKYECEDFELEVEE